MPQGPSQWATSPASDAIISASRLNYDMYTYTSNQFNPTGVHFHTFRPLFWEVLSESVGNPTTTGSGYFNLSQPSTGVLNPNGVTCYDTAGLWGAGADYIQGQYQFLPTVPGSDGGSAASTVPGGAGGYYILGHFVELNGSAAADVMGAGMQAESASLPVFDGGRHWRSTSRNNCAYWLDLVPTGPNAPANWAGDTTEFAPTAYTAQSGTITYNPMAVSNAPASMSTGAGEISRFFGFWQAINNGTVWGNQSLPAGTALQSSWPNGTAITSSLMQNSLANLLTFLGNPPSFRGGGYPTTSIPNNTLTQVPLPSNYNGLSNWNSGTSTYTIPVSGMYLIHGQASYSLAGPLSTFGARAGVTINGNTYLGPSVQFAAVGTSNACPQKTQIFSLQKGDTVQLATIQASGGTRTLASGVESKLVICWLGGNGNTFGGTIGSPVTTYADGYTGPPDTSFRWQAGTPPSTLQTQFQTHLGDDMTFLFNRPYFMGYQNSTTSTVGGASGTFSGNIPYDNLTGIVHGDNGDPWGGWNVTNKRWLAPVTGWYLVVHECRISTASTPTDVAAGLVATPTQGGVAPVSGATPDWYQHLDVSTASGNFPGATAIGLYYLVAGTEYISSQFLAHASSTPSTVNTGGFATAGPNHMEAIWLGA